MKPTIDLSTASLEYMADLVTAIQEECKARRTPGATYTKCADLLEELWYAMYVRDDDDGSLAADLAYDLREDGKL